MIKKFPIYFLFFSVVFLTACSADEISKEDEIRQIIESGKLAAENRNHNNLADLMAKSYSDNKGYDKQQLINLVRAYFFRHKNIHLFIKIDEITFKGENKVFVNMYVAMAGNVISDVNLLSSLRAKIYRFELQLIKQDEWLINQAKWQRSSFKEMMNPQHNQ